MNERDNALEEAAKLCDGWQKDMIETSNERKLACLRPMPPLITRARYMHS
jgi:hypothetical protein